MPRIQALLMGLAPCCVCVLVLLVAGCNQGRELPPLVEVTGQVTLDEKPLSQGVVVFSPDATQGNTGPMAAGAIDENGQYKVKTAGVDGAKPGWHTVTVEGGNQGFGPNDAGQRVAVPRAYSDPGTSTLKKEVKAGEKNVIDLELKSTP
ncbi:MAG: hypothetical protein JW888_04460 [Pirellulales bacterium]|nr:hypothetical protein [Pirellulales bacterium]